MHQLSIIISYLDYHCYYHYYYNTILVWLYNTPCLMTLLLATTPGVPTYYPPA